MRGERAKHEKTVIIRNLFEPELFDREVHLILDYQNDLREECGKCGTVRKVIVYDVSRHLIQLDSTFFFIVFNLISIFFLVSVIRKESHRLRWPTRRKLISSFKWWTADFSASESYQRKHGMAKRNTSKLILIALQPRALLRLINLSRVWNRIDESEADRTERLEKWQKYLESEEAKKEIAEKNQQTDGTETSNSECTEIESS